MRPARTIATLVAAAIACAACDTIPKPGTRSYLSVATRRVPATSTTPAVPSQTIGTLLVWSNDVNAGVIYEDGDICMQRAMATKVLSANGSLSAPASLISLSKAVEGAVNQGEPEAAIALSGAISQAAAALSMTTERTAFLDIGLFYLCQLEANESITPAQAAALTGQLITEAAEMAPTVGAMVTISGPQLGGDDRSDGDEGTGAEVVPEVEEGVEGPQDDGGSPGGDQAEDGENPAQDAA